MVERRSFFVGIKNLSAGNSKCLSAGPGKISVTSLLNVAVELTDQFLAKIAGWEAMKQARSLWSGGRVLEANYTPPRLAGLVQEGTTQYKAGLIIKDAITIENLCTCRQS